VAASDTREARSDALASTRHLQAMPKSKYRKRPAFELFVEALTQPVRFR
jgi:hypothetical protein